MEYYRYLVCRSRYALIVVLLILSNNSLNSQSVDLSLTTTYSNLPFLEAQKVRQDNQIFATLILNDFSFKNYNVRLRLSIEGNGVSISSNNLLNYKSFSLIPGIPKVLSSFELGDYFNPANLNFNGIDKNAFLENGTLPKGNYKLCFTVIDGESDGSNELSNTECDFLSVDYQEVPIITSDIVSVLDSERLEWKHNSILSGEVNYTIEIYEFTGGKDYEIYTYQKPEFVVGAGFQNSINISKQLSEMSKSKLFAFFVKVNNNQGSNYTFKNQGYSKPLYFENFQKSVPCEGEVVFEEIPGPNGTTLLHAYVVGCEAFSGGIKIGNYSPQTVPLEDNTGYFASFNCPNPNGGPPCVISGSYGNQNCIYGNPCETSPIICPGTYRYNCECKEQCSRIVILEETNSQGQLVLTPQLPIDCSEGDFQWSSGETTLSIIASPGGNYSFKTTCNGCCVYGVRFIRNNCWPGRWCSDGDPCTDNDKFNHNCDCVGEPIADCDPNDPTSGCAGTLSIDVTVDPSGGNFLTANTSDIVCEGGIIEYIWNGDYDINEAFFYTPTGGVVTLLIVCESGCTFEAEVDLNDCTPGLPCNDDGDPSTIEYYNEYCACISVDCPDSDGDGIADDCDEDQPCYGTISIVPDLPNQQLNVNIQDVECLGDITYLWSSGATTASIPFLNEAATYSVTVTCSSGCQYTDTSIGSDEECIVGAECENDKSCNGLGTINENCECIPSNPETNFDASFDIETNQITLEVELVDGACESPTYQWSTGETSASITITDLNSVYVVTVSCANNCEFIAIYSYSDGDCIDGAPCSDGDPCTINDQFDENCDCVGEQQYESDGTTPLTDCDETPCNTFIPCDDGNPCTYFDQIICDGSYAKGGEDDEYPSPCQGVYLNDENGMPIIDCEEEPCIVGQPCNDNDPCTENDAIDANCDCTGEQQYESDGTTPLTDCEETNPCLESLIIDVLPTNNYNEILISAISSCENVDSYQWSNGSGAASIVVTSQSGSYSVIVTCGDCQYIATYDTDGCLVGLPCNDGLDCTENDEVQENCACEGEPIEAVEITFETETVEQELCDYDICFPNLISKLYITSIDVILSNGDPFQLNQGSNNQGFDFPYTYSLSEPSNYIQLISDLKNWLPTPVQSIYTQNPNDFICSLNVVITDCSIEIVGLNGYTSLIPEIKIRVFKENCYQSNTIIGTNLTVLFDCEEVEGAEDQVLWSNGATGATVFIEDINSFESCLEVTVICANGCTYTATYGANCEGCMYGVVGSSCDDDNPCTIYDTVTEDCDCVGLDLPNSDGDEYCDEIDICPLGDDDIDLDNNGIPDACDEDFDCTGLLTAEISIETETEQCIYCLVLNHPIFTDPQNEEDIYLHSISVINDGVPQLLNSNTGGFSFPYLVENSVELLPTALIGDLFTFFGSDSEISIYETPDAVCLEVPEGGIGPNILGIIALPSKLLKMTFVWGGNNSFDMHFYESPEEPCETSTPYTLTANLFTEESEDCGAEPTYEWSNGSTENSIQVPSEMPEYSVTITCGECEIVAKTTPLDPECVVGGECTGEDICGDAYDGVYDVYCNCVSEDDTVINCDNGCDDEFEQIVEGVTVCCNRPPSLIHEEEPVEKVVYNSCFLFDENDIITGIQINDITINENNNVGDYFDFPYCIENNCSYYGESINIPYNLKSYKVFAYDLQKWAVANGQEFSVSTVYNADFCNECTGEGNKIYINGMSSDEKIFISINEESESMNQCEASVVEGYYVVFEEYTGTCNIIGISVKINYMEQEFGVYAPADINLGEYKFGPVPRKGVGFRAIITCEGGCIYDIVTPDADCIIGDPCDSPDVCATETYTSYDNEDCKCLIIGDDLDDDDDGVCNNDDQCPGFDDTLDADNDGIPNGCDPECDIVSNSDELCYLIELKVDFDDYYCARISTINFNIDGEIKDIKELYPDKFDFPYTFDSELEGCTNPSDSKLVNFADDLVAVGINAYSSFVILEETNEIKYELVIINSPYIITGFNSGAYSYEGGAPPFYYNTSEINCNNFCDDGWDCTINDHYDDECNCVGTYVDSDNDMVCDVEDQCPGYPDYIDTNNNGKPDGCEDDIYVPCPGLKNGIPYCEFIKDFLACGRGKVKYNNLVIMNTKLAALFHGDPKMLDYLPFPNLKDELANLDDEDGDGIVDILDPCPCQKAEDDGTHPESCMYDICEIPCENLTNNFTDPEYMKERYTIMNMFLYTVNPGVLVGTNNDDSSNPEYSECFHQLKTQYGLNEGDYNESGYVFSQTTGCYIYFELDCDCKCLVVESEAFNYAEDCDDPLVIGDECTQDESQAGMDGYHYVECPPSGADACMIYAVVSNPDYDPYDPGDDVPCSCEQQMSENGEPSETVDTDGDTVCDILDVCGPDFNEDGTPILTGTEDYLDSFNDLLDSDGDGVPNCLDKCDGVDYAATQSEADAILEEFEHDDNPDNDNTIVVVANKEGYSTPSGPGDICDDGNACTYDDVITEDCNCQGVYIDLDDDGVYDCEECDFVESPEGSGMYIPCGTCGGTVTVDEIGNTTDPGAPGARTLLACDVCPGIPDGDPEDQDDFPMDYNNNGLPDCIDPPFKPICPYDYEIAGGVGLVLFFDTDDLDEGDYPEPISFQGISTSNGELVYHDYLTVDYTREVVVEVEDETSGELIEKTITQVYYTIPYTSFDSGEFEQAIITYSDHQSCVLTNNDIVPLPCPYSISIKYGKISFNQSDLGEIDLSELLGEYVIQSGDEIVKIEPMVDDIEFTNSLVKVDVEAELFDVFPDPFSGTITLPSGLVCEFTSGNPEECDVIIDGVTVAVTIGTPCDDGKECTHHDKYIDNGGDYCECIGELKPDADLDDFCDAVDPCPDFANTQPTEDLNGDQILDYLDINDCPCPMLELSTFESELPGLQNGNDFYVYFTGDLSGYANITIEVNNGQDDPFDPTGGDGAEAVSPMVIGNLISGFEYTITISAYCENGEAETLTFTIDVPFEETPIICGVEINPEEIASYTLLPSLSVGEEFMASDFIVNVRSVSGGYGKFSGKGYISVPYFNAARLNVIFDDIIINDKRKMIDGYLEINGYGLAILGDDISDAINSSLDSIIGVLDDLDDVLEHIIPVLEGIDALIDQAGEFVDEETKNCLKTKEAQIMVLEEQAKATNPEPTEAQIAQIKLDIEKLAGELKICMDSFNAQVDAYLEDLINVLVPITINLQNECSQNVIDDLEIAYDEVVGDLMEDYTANQDLLIQSLPANKETELEEILGEEMESELAEYESKITEESEPFDPDLLIQSNAFYEIENNLQYCNLMSSFNGQLTLEEAKEILRIFLNVGEEFGGSLKSKLDSGMTNQEIINETDEGNLTDLMRTYIKKSLQYKSYKNIKE